MSDALEASILTLDEIFAARDIEEVDVPVPQWPKADGSPGKVRIKTFTKKQADKMRKDATRHNPRTRQDEVDSDKLEALLFIEGVLEPKFDLAGYEKLREKSASAVALVQKAIMVASGLAEAAVADADKSDGQGSGSEVLVPAVS